MPPTPSRGGDSEFVFAVECERLGARISAIEGRVAELKEAKRELREAEQRAVDAFAESVQERLNKVNEFREQLADQARTFLPRAEYDSNHKALEERLEAATKITAEQTRTFLPRQEYDVNHKALGDRLDSVEKSIREQVRLIGLDLVGKIDSDKFMDQVKADKDAREKALERVNEKLDDYITRIEARQREIDIAIQTQQTAADAARRFAEQAAQSAKDHAAGEAAKAKDAALEASRRTNRNILVAGIVITAVVGLANWISANSGVIVPPPFG